MRMTERSVGCCLDGLLSARKNILGVQNHSCSDRWENIGRTLRETHSRLQIFPSIFPAGRKAAGQWRRSGRRYRQVCAFRGNGQGAAMRAAPEKVGSARHNRPLLEQLQNSVDSDSFWATFLGLLKVFLLHLVIYSFLLMIANRGLATQLFQNDRSAGKARSGKEFCGVPRDLFLLCFVFFINKIVLIFSKKRVYYPLFLLFYHTHSGK